MMTNTDCPLSVSHLSGAQGDFGDRPFAPSSSPYRLAFAATVGRRPFLKE
jgi:hypothetical protein